MRRGATATHIFNINSGIVNPKAVQISYGQGYYFLLQKQLDEVIYENKSEGDLVYGTKITVTLSQEETMQFSPEDFAVVQIRIITDEGKSLVSTTAKIKIEDCIDNNILPLGNKYTPFIKPKEHSEST